MENIVKAGKNTIIAHLNHLKDHKEFGYLKEAMDFLMEKGIKMRPADLMGSGGPKPCACPGSQVKEIKRSSDKKAAQKGQASQLETWPVQLKLVPAFAPFLNGADVLIAADCVPFAYPDFHADLLKGKVLLVGCPKLDDVEYYREKITQILQNNDIKSITYAHMEVPCCFGLLPAIKDAIAQSGKDVPFEDVTISIKGERR
jgi:hypothetical protein